MRSVNRVGKSMQDLRLVGVHEDSEHLLLSGAGGEIYRLRIDEALRVASSRTPPRQSAPMSQDSAPTRLSPKDIQQRIRGGATAEEVAEAAGVPLEHVQRYEGPVLAEREHIALQARRVEVSDAIPSHDGYRSAFGDDPASLDEMVSHRLIAMGVDASTLIWDAWRRPDGQWAVTADFDSSKAPAAGGGESAPAQWIYSISRKAIQNTNRWAQLLSEMEPLDAPLPSRRLAAVADRPFDFETDRSEIDPSETDSSEPLRPETNRPEPDGVETPSAADPVQNDSSADNEPNDNTSDGLLDLLRSRRGQRLGVDEADDDALALLLTDGVPAAQPRADRETTGQTSEEDEPAPEQPAFFPALSLAPALRPDPVEQPAQSDDFTGTVRPDPLELSDGVSTQTREVRISATPPARPGAATRAPAARPASPGAEKPAKDVPDDTADDATPADRRPAVKPKRSSVPSWDEIVFGTKGD